jgi:hypothetical protein
MLRGLIVLSSVALSVGVSGCGRGKDTTPPSFGSACAADGDCMAPFTCMGGQATPHSCTKTCSTDADCPRYHWSPPCLPHIDTDVKSSCGNDGLCRAFIACQYPESDDGPDGN